MITLLTATYNRAHTLPALYDSLLQQPADRIEWVVVDDGSSDDTEALIQRYQAEGRLRIEYVRQENGGKHVALNRGVAQASGDWIFIIDSDDLVTPDAVTLIEAALLEQSERTRLVGVCFRKRYFDGEFVGRKELPRIEMLSPTAASHLVGGDLGYVFSRAAMASVPFPVIAGEKFVPELYIWNKIGDQGEIVFYLQDTICLGDYLDDGYSRNFKTHLRRNPRGFLLFYASQFWRERDLVSRLKCLVRSAQCLVYAARKRLAGG